jgi:hypothetical protein
MSFTDQDKHALSDIVTGFTLAIVGVCRAWNSSIKLCQDQSLRQYILKWENCRLVQVVKL